MSTKYYDPATIITKQVPINFIVGARSVGKTYGFKKFLINKAIKTGRKFIYLRRNIVEIETVINFFGTVEMDEAFKDVVFQQKGNMLYYAKTKDENDVWDWIHIGIMYGLTDWRKIKSNEYPEFDYILYDEWQPGERGGFLKNEPRLFLDVMLSVFRGREGQAFLLGNSSVLYNPYFTYLDINPNVFQEFTRSERDKDGFVKAIVQILDSREWAESQAHTMMSKIIRGTPYEEFALENKFSDNDSSLVERKSKTSKNIAIFSIQGEMVGVWYDKRTKFVHMSEQYNPSLNIKYGFYPDDYDENHVSYREVFTSGVIEIILEARKNNKIRFTSTKAKSISADALERLRIY